MRSRPLGEYALTAPGLLSDRQGAREDPYPRSMWRGEALLLQLGATQLGQCLINQLPHHVAVVQAMLGSL